ncbi:unnamed protein product [Urochloa humidicola]
MKAVERAKLVRSLRQESRRLRVLVLVIGFFLVTLTFVVVSKPDALLFNLNGRLSVDQAPRSLLIRQRVDDDKAASRRSADTLAAAAQDPKVVDDDNASEEANTRGASEDERRALSSQPEQGIKTEEATATERLGGEDEEGRKEGHQEHQEYKVTLPTVSNYTIHDAAEDSDNGKQEDGKTDAEIKAEMDVDHSNDGNRSQQRALDNMEWDKPLCDFSNF